MESFYLGMDAFIKMFYQISDFILVIALVLLARLLFIWYKKRIISQRTTNEAITDPFDPTIRDDLQTLKTKVSNQLNSQEWFNELQNSSKCLVLSGGGGKGAYEIGVILALFDCNIRTFDALSGTSVGGLNAALSHLLFNKSDRNLVLQIWSDMSFSKVLKLSWATLLKLMLYCLLSVLAFSNMPRTISAILFYCGFSDPALLIKFNIKDWLFATIKAVSLGLSAIGIGLIFAWLLVEFVFKPIFLEIDLLNAGGLAVIFSFYILPSIAGRLSRKTSLSTSESLKKTIKSIDIEYIQKNAPPVICTLATPLRLKNWWSRILFNESFYSVADYFSLSETESCEQAIDVLVQTAALPEIFPTRSVFGTKYVDGGVADNTPILSVAQFQTQQLIVVYLDHRINRMLKPHKFFNHMKHTNKGWIFDPIYSLKRWEYSRLSEISRNRGEVWETDYSDWYHKLEIVPIIPSRPLGNLVTGTLNFTKKKAHELIALGYEDTLNQLSTMDKLKPCKSN